MCTVKYSAVPYSTCIINLHPKKYGQVLRYYLFVVDLDRCMGICNTLSVIDFVPGKIKVENKRTKQNKKH